MPEEGVDREKRATLRQFAALGAAGPLSRFADGDGEGGEPLPREAITGYLAATPGAHFSKLRDDLHLGTGETQHHLRRLIDEDTVESVRDGDYRRLFLAGEFDAFEQVALGYLRRDTPRGMVIELLSNPGASGADLADALGVSRATVSNYAAELEERGLLAREGGYSLERPETVLLLLTRYADSFGPAARDLAAGADALVSYDP
jgi:predicted transcriptional regulator